MRLQSVEWACGVALFSAEQPAFVVRDDAAGRHHQKRLTANYEGMGLAGIGQKCECQWPGSTPRGFISIGGQEGRRRRSRKLGAQDG